MSGISRREFIAGHAGAAAWPMVVPAQRPTVPVVGYLSANRPETVARNMAAFRAGLREAGYIEGQNVAIEYRWAESQYDRLPGLAADLVRRQVAVIATNGFAASTAKAATATIPIVFESGSDPVKVGLVDSLNRPGGNVTGIFFLARVLLAKRLELLHQVMPAAKTIAFLDNPSPPADPVIPAVEDAARALGLRLLYLQASNPSEIEVAFKTIGQERANAIMVGSDPMFFDQRDQLVALTSRHGLPATYHDRQLVEAGGLMSYGARIVDGYRLVGVYTGRILKGEKPADLPVQQSTRIELIINLRTAKTLGLTIPETLLATADEVIQ
jgi:putative tryptophan/tyrosine transport system substrate-binding protein